MTDKERLEDIKGKYSEVTVLEYINDVEVVGVDIKDLVWLINRVEELELEINDWRAEVRKWQRFYKESEESHSETKELLKSIVNQNKRQAEKMEYWRRQHRKRCNELEDAYFKIQLLEN